MAKKRDIRQNYRDKYEKNPGIDAAGDIEAPEDRASGCGRVVALDAGVSEEDARVAHGRDIHTRDVARNAPKKSRESDIDEISADGCPEGHEKQREGAELGLYASAQTHERAHIHKDVEDSSVDKGGSNQSINLPVEDNRGCRDR